MELKDHINKFCIRLIRVHGRVGAGNADARICQQVRYLGDHSRLIIDIKTHIIGCLRILDTHDVTLLLIRKETAVAAVMPQAKRRLNDVGNH